MIKSFIIQLIFFYVFNKYIHSLTITKNVLYSHGFFSWVFKNEATANL